jgi:hypothetical protein
MSIVFILLGALAATLFIVTKLGLHTPPAENVTLEVVPNAQSRLSREDIRLAA